MGVKDASRIHLAASLASRPLAIALLDELVAYVTEHWRSLRRTLVFFVRHRSQATVVHGPLSRGGSGWCTCGEFLHCFGRICRNLIVDIGVDDVVSSQIQLVWAIAGEKHDQLLRSSSSGGVDLCGSGVGGFMGLRQPMYVKLHKAACLRRFELLELKPG